MPIRISLPEINLDDGVSFLCQRSVRETFRLHCHDFYELFYIINGKAIHNINGEYQLLSDGDFVLIRPDDTHKYEFLDNFDFEIISVGFSCKNFSDAVGMLQTEPSVFTDPKMPPTINLRAYDFNDIYRKLCRIDRAPIGKDRQLYFRSILPYLLYSFISYSNDQHRLSIPVWLTDLINEMSKPENYIAGLQRLLELSHMSQEHLTREFRRHIDLSPTEFINLKRLNYAAELILEGNMEITDICYACGFNNMSHFYHCFKKQYGCAPRLFAKINSDN